MQSDRILAITSLWQSFHPDRLGDGESRKNERRGIPYLKMRLPYNYIREAQPRASVGELVFFALM